MNKKSEALAVPVNVDTSHSFSDVPSNHANYVDVMYLLENSVIDATSTYGINVIVTREEVAVMVAKAIGLDGSPQAYTYAPTNYKNCDEMRKYYPSGVSTTHPACDGEKDGWACEKVS